MAEVSHKRGDQPAASQRPAGIDAAFSPALTHARANLVHSKVDELVHGGCPQFLAEQLVNKQMECVRRQAIILSRTLDHPLYAEAFVDALAEADRLAEFFGMGRQDLLRQSGLELSDHDLFLRYRTFLEINELPEQKESQSKPQWISRASIPSAAEVTESNFLLSLEETVSFAGKSRPGLESRTRQLLEEKQGDDLLDEVYLAYDRFLYSESYSLDFFKQLQELADEASLSLSEVIESRPSRLTDSEKFIVSEVEKRARVTYAEYMEMALYDEKYGFYTRERDEAVVGGRDGESGEFSTMPEQFRDFGRGVAVDLFSRWQSLGCPAEFQVIEMGAGQGTMARDILQAIEDKRKSSPEWRQFAEAVSYQIVEKSGHLVDRQKERLGSLASRVSWIHGSAANISEFFDPDSVTGVFLSNELPDAFPVHKVRAVNGELKEVYVAVENGVLVETEGEISTPALREFLNVNQIELAEGESRVINLQALDWLDSLNAVLREGFIMTFDYGHSNALNRAALNLQPQFRKYGGQINQERGAFLGFDRELPGIGELALVTESIAAERGEEVMLGIMADALKAEAEYAPSVEAMEILKQHSRPAPVREMEEIMKEYISSPLPCSGNVDITTDADFPSMERRARALGMHRRFFGTQDAYFQKCCYPDKESRQALDPRFFSSVQRYKVQVFEKRRGAEVPERMPLPSAQADLLLRGCLETVDDIDVLLDFLEEADPAGLGGIAAAVRGYAERTGRPLAGISSDSVLRFAPQSGPGGAFVINRDENDSLSISVPSGTPLTEVIVALVDLVPSEALPDQYQEYCNSIPEPSENMSFSDLNSAVFRRLVKMRALKTHAGAAFFMAIHEMGYSDVPELDVDPENIRQMVDSGMDATEELAGKSEPLRTQNQLNALRIAAAIAAGEEVPPREIRWRDLFTFRNGRFEFNQASVPDVIRELWVSSIGEDPAGALMELGASIPVSSYAPVLQMFSGGEFDMKMFFVVKELLIGHIVDLLERRIDKDREIEPQVVETDLGPRFLPPVLGDASRIEEEPEDSRHLIAVLGKYAAYAEHSLRADPERVDEANLLNLIRILDPSRDVKLLERLVAEIKDDDYESHKGSFELAMVLYEKGFKARAREIIASRGYYYWKEDLVEFLSRNGETELLAPYLAHRREELTMDGLNRRSINFSSLATLISDDEEAAALFEEEWAYIKDAMRVFILACKDGSFPSDSGGWWKRNKSGIDLASQPFDVFSPERGPGYPTGSFSDPGQYGEWMLLPLKHFELGLKDPRFRARAIELIEEFDDSPMKLKLYEQASQSLPEEWTPVQAQTFFERWSHTLHAVGSQLRAHDYEEPHGDFSAWPSRWANHEGPSYLQKRLMPRRYTASRFFHEGAGKILEASSRLAEEREGFGSMREIASGVVSQLTFRKGLSYNPVPVQANEYNWRVDFFHYSGNEYASLWAQSHLDGGAVSADEFRRIWKRTSAPLMRLRDKYDVFDLVPAGRSDDIPWVYGRSVVRYVENMKSMYALAVRCGFEDDARHIHDHVRHVILDARDTVAEEWHYRECRESIGQLENYWAVQEVLQKLLAGNGSDEAKAEFEVFFDRVSHDTRGFFTPDSLADAACELSRRPECRDYSIRLFRATVDRLAPRRGQNDWFSDDLQRSISESRLSDSQKDETYLYLLTQMWPEEGSPLDRLFFLYAEKGSLHDLIAEVFSGENRFPQSRSFLLTELAATVRGMDPLKYGDELREGFRGELAGLNFLAGKFADRAELADPARYEQLKGLYTSEEEALSALEPLLPDQVKADRLKAKTTALPTLTEIEQGKFDAAELEEQLAAHLDPANAEAVWQEAFGVLEAWLRRDVIEIVNARRKKEGEKKFEDQREVIITDEDLSNRASYRMAWRIASPLLRSTEAAPFASRAAGAILETKEEKEAAGKAFIAYGLLRDKDVPVEFKKQAFDMLVKGGYLPGYVGFLYRQRIGNAPRDSQEEFFRDITLWDHTVPANERPTVIWVHLFEAEGEKRERLRERIMRYRADEEHWQPDLQVDEDWWILHHQFRKGYSDYGSEQSCAAWSYQRFLKHMGLSERVGFLMGDDYGMDQVITSYLVDNWDRLEELNAREMREIYQARCPEGERSWDLQESLRIATRIFYERQTLFLKFKDAIDEGTKPELEEPQNREQIWCIFELLKTAGHVQPEQPVGLQDLLRARFPSLGENAVSALYALACDPFQVEEDVRRENQKNVGKSKDWWSSYTYRYFGERIFHERVLEAAGKELPQGEQAALLSLMYPFSKTHYYNAFSSLNEMFPYEMPAKSYGYEKKAKPDAARLLLSEFADYSFAELDELAARMPYYARVNLATGHRADMERVARRMPSYARMDLAGRHQMDLYKIALPETFSGYHELAIFLIKTYLGILKIGALEEVSEELKGLPADEALYKFFVVRDMPKVGQLLASRPEVPDHYREILARLEDRVAPSDIEEVRNTVQTQLGWKTGDFTLVRALNAGSMGEVWLAQHRKYPFDLAVKVLTPSKEKKITETIKELKELQEVLEWYCDVARGAAIGYEVVGKIISLMENELDFRKDKTNWEAMFGFDMTRPDPGHIREDGTIPIPGTKFHAAMYYEAEEKALVMSYVDGVNINDPDEGITDPAGRTGLAQDLWEYLQDRVFNSENGIYPTDLHSGNIMRTRRTQRNVLIDTGQVGQMTQAARDNVMQFLLAAYMGNVQETARSIVSMGHTVRQEEVDEQGLSEKIGELLSADGDPVARVRDLFVHAPFFQLFVDNVFVDLLKGLMISQGTLLRLDPEFSLMPG